MPKYKNCSGSSYIFYGVMFHPWDVHDVPGTISHPKFVVSDDPETRSEKVETAKADVTTTEANQQIPFVEQEETKRSKRSKGE